MRPFTYLLFIILTCSAYAEEAPTRQYQLLDRTHSLLKDNLDTLANRVDSFFATERADDEFGRSRLRVRYSYHIREQERGDSDISYRLNFRIPSLDKKIKEGTEKLFPKRAEKSPGGSSSLVPKSREDWYFNADVGVNASIPPKAVLRTRLRKNILYQKWSHRFSEEVTYITEEDGLTEETSFTSDYPITDQLLLRIQNSKTWKVLSKQFVTHHGPNLIHQVSQRDAFHYSLIATSIIHEEGPWVLDNYRLSVRYRRDLYQNWLFFDLHPGWDFPKKYSFRRNPFVTFQLEALFGS